MTNYGQALHINDIKARGRGICMNLFLWIVIFIICYIIIKSMTDFILKDGQFSTETFYSLLIIYSIVIIGFGLIYFILSFQGIILVEQGKYDQVNVLGSLIHSFYFSGVTLLTIGYGDIVPIGIGRLIVLIQALIGYVLPTAFMIRIVNQRK